MIPAHRRVSLALCVATLAGSVVMLQSWAMRSMWVDRAFTPVRYAFSFAFGQAGRLPGQEAAAMGFGDPLWVSLLTLFSGLGLEPVRMLPSVGMVMAGLVVAIMAGDAWHRFGKAAALIPAFTFAAASPMLVASKSGANDAWLALWTIMVLVSANRDLSRCRFGWMTHAAVFVLALTGPFGVLASMGVVWFGARTLWVPIGLAVLLQVGALLGFGIDSPTALLVDIEQMEPSRLLIGIKGLPVMLCAGLGGIMAVGAGHPSVRFAVWCWVVWMVRGATGADDVGAMADRFAPALAMVGWLAAHLFDRMRHRGWTAVLLCAVCAVDVYASRSGIEEASRERRVTLKESQVMARFLKWRFEPREVVALHSPGSIAYHYGGPVIDVSGRTETRDVSPMAVLSMNPAAMIPLTNYVGPTVTFTPMFKGLTTVVRKQYDHHSVQHQKKWGLTYANPVFFQYLMRKDLPRLPASISEEDGNRFPKQ